MSSIMKADIFFVISALGVVVVTIAVSIAAYYVARAAKDTSGFIRSARSEFEELRQERMALMHKFRYMQRFLRAFFRREY